MWNFKVPEFWYGPPKILVKKTPSCMPSLCEIENPEFWLRSHYNSGEKNHPPVCGIEKPEFWYGPPKILVKKTPSCMWNWKPWILVWSPKTSGEKNTLLYVTLKTLNFCKVPLKFWWKKHPLSYHLASAGLANRGRALQAIPGCWGQRRLTGQILRFWPRNFSRYHCQKYCFTEYSITSSTWYVSLKKKTLPPLLLSLSSPWLDGWSFLRLLSHLNNY